MKYWSLVLVAVVFFSCSSSTGQNQQNTDEEETENQTDTNSQTDSELFFLDLPDNYSMQIYADDVENARQLELADDGTLFIGTRKNMVHAVRDTDGDNRADEQYTIVSGLNMPNGVALRNGDLYIAEVSRILKFENVLDNLSDDMDYEVVYDNYPTDEHHGWKFISFGPDGKLYVPVGAPCNICKSEKDVYATITRINPDGTNMEIVQEGIRNTVGFNWHPETDELWFTDNGGDNLGDNMPGDELNYAPRVGMHFGFPYCHQGNYADPDYGNERDCSEFTPPVQILGPHVAALGMEFWNNTQFPSTMNNKVFIAEHGSWNRTIPIGYRITTVDVTAGGEASNYQVWVDGFRDNEKDKVYGRPVDLEWMPDGSLLISDDKAGKVYRMFYSGNG